MTEEINLNQGILLTKEFFQKNCLEVSENLIGKILVHKLKDGTKITGRIIETEGKFN